MKIDYYKHLDIDSKLKVEIDIPALAAQVNKLNYGTHRFLSALVHELRAKTKAMNDKWNSERNETEPTSPFNSILADGIEKLLNEGAYY